MVIREASCRCGRVRFRAEGAPIVVLVCYCEDCQAGGRLLEARPGAGAVLEPDGGTAYLVYRDDRFACSEGGELLVDHRLTPMAPTRRVTASCCNAALFVKFDKGHWVSAYRGRFVGDPPPVELRTQTKHRRAAEPLPDDAPSAAGFGPTLLGRLLKARLAMALGR
jgi:hypothetical protein